MKVTAKTAIYGYKAEMMEVEGNMNCYIENGRYTASLAALIDTGTLTDGDNEITVDDKTIDAIEEWALKHGY